MAKPAELPGILERLLRGEPAAREEPPPFVHDELHRLASRALARAPAGRSPQTTAPFEES